ncbi:NAD(P)/FAD-dependent oxidoreductase [Comamonas nitrativorans]|uniref:NAD(P)/FAD-dependent oxidoreductase n=1 Tax=Comamonas nitrativorans TaxID=108437 RepID=A0ABV9H3Q4_9BURK
MKLNLTPPLKRSYWQESIAASEPTAALCGAQKADVAIIGGGFVGLWTALTLKELEPDCQVVVLEQDVCGGGASGRNGGFAMSWWPKIGTLQALCGAEQALFLAREAEQAVQELGVFCRKHAIDAHFVRKGWLWTATTPAHLDAWNGTLQTCERLGVQPFERLSLQNVQSRTGSSIHLAAVFEASNATVQPAALVDGMRRVALAAGVRIHERSGVARIDPGAPAVLHTEGGQLQADKVVLATNAWAAAIPELARLITPVNSAIAVTKPLGAALENIGWMGGEAITDSQLMVNYYRTTRDGRIAFGKGTGGLSWRSEITDVFSNDAPSIAMTCADLFHTYPFLEKDSVSHGWSGPIDRTYDSLPVFGHLQGHANIFYGIGWSGNGVSPSRLGGRILASMALGRKDVWSQCGLVDRTCKAFPPEPFRYVGGSLVRNAVIRKEQAEMNGKRPAALDRFFASLAPSGLEDKS